MDEKYRQRREDIEKFFVESSRLADKIETVVSPSGKYELSIANYKTGERTWNYTRGAVRKVPGGDLIADIKRNYSHFWYCWHIHRNSCEYLLCGEDYQGYTVVNLTRNQVHTYFPDAGYGGGGFCWTAAYPSPDSTILAVDGCYWACPYDLVFFDFSNPDILPYRELARVEMLDEVEGWKDNETFTLRVEQEFRKSDGKLYRDLSYEEQERLDNDPSLIGYAVKTIEYRPREIIEE